MTQEELDNLLALEQRLQGDEAKRHLSADREPIMTLSPQWAVVFTHAVDSGKVIMIAVHPAYRAKKITIEDFTE